MTGQTPTKPLRPFQKYVVLGTALVISWMFYRVVSPFVLSVFMAAIIAGMVRPGYLWVGEKLGGRYRLASVVTILLLLVLVVIPAFFLLGALVSQAVAVSDGVTPWLENRILEVDRLEVCFPEVGSQEVSCPEICFL